MMFQSFLGLGYEFDEKPNFAGEIAPMSADPIVPPLRRVATDLGFTEGPVWTNRGTLLAVGLSRGLVYEIDVQTGDVLAGHATGGRPNGLAAGIADEIWVAQAGKGRVLPSLQHIAGGVIRTIAADFSAPNDLTFGPGGELWFTDPKGEALTGRPEEGRVWTYDPGRDTFELKASGVLYPNGLAFDKWGLFLYVAETATARILRYPVNGGQLGKPEVFIQMSAGHPDGIAFDADGNLYVASTTDESAQVYDRYGVLAERIAIGAGLVTNLCFGGSDYRTLFVTTTRGGSIYSVERQNPGLPLIPAPTPLAPGASAISPAAEDRRSLR
jgi:gluconolactonase